MSGRRPYLGYRDGDAETPWGRWFTADMAPLAPHVADAVAIGGVAAPLMTPFDDVPSMIEADETPVETGYAIGRDGSMLVATRLDMADVTPAMWDWWFSWHGDDARKYKLWHPRAHLSAEWADGGGARPGARSYVGRTSRIAEYLGSTYTRAAISFVAPSEFGIDPAALDATGATAVCARLALVDRPLDIGCFVHHVRPTDRGAEMRSRFYVGGRHASLRGPGPLSGRSLPDAVARAASPGPRGAADLMVHCAQEMAHLAGFLPQLHAELSGAA